MRAKCHNKITASIRNSDSPLETQQLQNLKGLKPQIQTFSLIFTNNATVLFTNS